MRTFTVINQKGGCGKTTTAINLGAAFARAGCRTLLVDLDPQSHCAAGLGIPEERLDLDVSDALRLPTDQTLNRSRLIWHVGRNFDLLPSRMKLAGIEAPGGGLADQEHKELRLRSVLRRLTRPEGTPGAAQTGETDGADTEATDPTAVPSRYDVCVIDCPPSIGLLSYNAIAAGREVIIPVETSFFSLRGAAKQVHTARSIARRLGMRIQPRLLATMHDPSQPLARDLLDDLRDRFGSGMIPVVVRYDHALKEAASFGQPVDEYAPDSMGAEDYRSVCEWLIEHANIERPEPDQDDTHGLLGPDTGGAMPAPTLGGAGARARVVAANLGITGDPASGGKLTRAQELAMRAREMQTQTSEVKPAAEMPVSMMGVYEPMKRSLMPHKPVAIEIRDDRVKPPNQRPAVASTRVRHLFGVRHSSTGVLFVQPGTLGERVAIAGDFNNWDPIAGQMTHNEALGVFEKHIKMPAGTYEYKLVIDGRWVLDEYNPQRTDNGMGSSNNLISVG